MFDTIAQVVIQIGNWFKQLQARQFLAIVAIGFILLNVTPAPDRASKATTDKLEQMLEQENPNRPKTNAEWEQQARQVKGKPGGRIGRIGEQSADAIKEFGKMDPDVAKRSANKLKKTVENN